jgi:hypothetical protein
MPFLATPAPRPAFSLAAPSIGAPIFAAPAALLPALPLLPAPAILAALPAPAPVQALPALQLTVARLSAASAPAPDDQREFLNRLFGEKAMGVTERPAPGAPARPPALAAVKADIERFLSHVAAEKPGWKSGASYARALTARVDRVRAAGGIPRRVPDGWLKTKIVVEPLRPEVLAMLPEFAETLRLIMMGDRPNLNEFLYSFNTLAQRQPGVPEILKEIDWLYGTYRLGRPKP